MAASADATITIVEGAFQNLPVKASTKIYEGAMVGASGGYARGLVAGDAFLGHCDKQADNSGHAVNGYMDVRVRTGRYCLEATITGVAVTDIGAAVYASADDTLTLTAGSNSYVGRVVRYVTTNTAVVMFCPTPWEMLNHEHTGASDGGKLTSPRVVTGLNDTNGNELIKVTATTDAVNEITLANAATGNGPTITASGETNVPITIAAKGTGKVILGQATSAGVQLAASQPILDENGNELIKFTATGSAVDEITLTNGKSGTPVSIAVTGGSTNQGLTVAAKGTGTLTLGQATGSVQICTVGTDKLGLFGTTPAVQQAHVDDAPAGGTGATAGAYDSAANRDAMIASLNAVIAALEAYGILKAS